MNQKHEQLEAREWRSDVDLQARIAELEFELDQRDKALQAAEDAYHELAAEAEAAQREIEALNEAMADLQVEEADAAQREIEALNDTLADLQIENDELRRQLGEDVHVPSDEEPLYLGSKTRNRFHRPHCKWAREIRADHLIEFGSHKEAVEAGYKPCWTCRA